MTFEIDKEVFNRDSGYFYIYKRSDRKKPTWNVFLKLNNDTGFTRRSCKTADKYKAKGFGDALYEELVITGTTKSFSFDNVISEYKLTVHNNKFSKIKYAIKFWQGENISALTDRDLQLFIAYRKTPECYGNYAPPSNSTLRREFNVINQFFIYCYSHSYTQELLTEELFINIAYHQRV